MYHQGKLSSTYCVNNKEKSHKSHSVKVAGEIILTRYNNKTYRGDDIDWDKHPCDSFTKGDGSTITCKDEYG